MHKWLLVSYAIAIFFRCVQYLGQLAAFRDLEERVARSKHCLGARCRSCLIWAFNAAFLGIALPAFLTWTVLGSFWYRDVTAGTNCVGVLD